MDRPKHQKTPVSHFQFFHYFFNTFLFGPISSGAKRGTIVNQIHRMLSAERASLKWSISRPFPYAIKETVFKISQFAYCDSPLSAGCPALWLCSIRLCCCAAFYVATRAWKPRRQVWSSISANDPTAAVGRHTVTFQEILLPFCCQKRYRTFSIWIPPLQEVWKLCLVCIVYDDFGTCNILITWEPSIKHKRYETFCVPNWNGVKTTPGAWHRGSSGRFCSLGLNSC